MLNASAESSEFPLRNLNSVVYRSPIRVKGKKNFPEKRYGNNQESPSFLQLPKIYDNTYSRENIYAIRNSNKSNDTYPIAIKELTKFSEKPNFIMKQSIKESITRDLPFIYPQLNCAQSSYLKNVNEYNIRESYKIDQSRIVTYERKLQNDYNCVTDKRLKVLPADVQMEKWPLFYENYYSLANNAKAFHIKEGLFTKLLDNKLIGAKLQSNRGSPDTSSNSIHYVNTESSVQSVNSSDKTKSINKDSSIRLVNSFTKARKVIQDHNLYKLKNYKISK